MEDKRQTEVDPNMTTDNTATLDGYVAPGVAAAMRGEQVDFSMNVAEPAADTDTDA